MQFRLPEHWKQSKCNDFHFSTIALWKPSQVSDKASSTVTLVYSSVKKEETHIIRCANHPPFHSGKEKKG